MTRSRPESMLLLDYQGSNVAVVECGAPHSDDRLVFHRLSPSLRT